MSAFDEIGLDGTDIKKFKKDKKVIDSKVDYLIHKVFTGKEGAELLSMWKDSVLMIPGDTSGTDSYSLGKVEGFNRHIRYLIRVIKKVGEE